MSDILPVEMPGQNKDQWDFFAFVVDGEVADQIAWEKTSLHAAVLKSDPLIVLVPDNLKNIVRPGWSYVNGVFYAPQGV